MKVPHLCRIWVIFDRGDGLCRAAHFRFAPKADVRSYNKKLVAMGPGRVKSLRGITAPGILRLVVTLRAKKCKNSSSAQRYSQIRFRFHTA